MMSREQLENVQALVLLIAGTRGSGEGLPLCLMARLISPGAVSFDHGSDP